VWEDLPKGFGCGNESSTEKKAQGGVQKKKGSRGSAEKRDLTFFSRRQNADTLSGCLEHGPNRVH
jgi:hypothetical protein